MARLYTFPGIALYRAKDKEPAQNSLKKSPRATMRIRFNKKIKRARATFRNNWKDYEKTPRTKQNDFGISPVFQCSSRQSPIGASK